MPPYSYYSCGVIQVHASPDTLPPPPLPEPCSRQRLWHWTTGHPPDQVTHCCDTVHLTGWNPYLVVSHLINRVYALIWWCFLPTGTADGRTQQIDTDDDFMSFFLIYCIMSYETPLCISSDFCELAASSILSTHACWVASAELTIKKTQRQLQSENLIISNLKMNLHHSR